MSDINKLWSILKNSSMNDKDMQKAFERAVTPNACIELLEDIDTMQARINELAKAILETLDDHGDLADGDVCTLIKLKRAVGL